MTTAAVPPRPPLSPARRWVLGLGVVLSLLVIAWGVLLLVDLLGRTSEDRSATLPATSGQLVVSSSSGGIRVAAGDVSDVQIVTHLRYGLSTPRLRQEARPDAVYLAASCPWYSNYCSVRYEITVPRTMAVRAESSGGSVSVRAVSGSVETDSSGGSITVTDTTGSVRARSSGGGITIRSAGGFLDLDTSGGGVVATGLRGDARASSSGGGVRLIFDTPPQSVTANSSGGNVEVFLPRVAGGYRVDATSSGGDQVIEVPTDPASTRRIMVRSSGGDARVLTAGSQ